MAAEDYFDLDACGEEERDDGPRVWPRKAFKPQQTQPLPAVLSPREGHDWDKQQERKLLRDFEAGYTLKDLAHRMGRTTLGITYRLEKLGIDPYRSGIRPVAQPVKEQIMNKMHLLALLQTGYTTVQVCFDDNGKGQTYTYKAPTKMDIAVGDMLVVPARDTFSLGWVKAVDKLPKIDVKAPFEYRWVVQKVDTSAFTDQTEREAQALEQLEDAQRAEAQRKAMELLLGPTVDSSAFLALINAQG